MNGLRALVLLAAAAVAATSVAAATAGSEAATAGPGYKVVGKWGKIGTGSGQLASNVAGIAVDKAGRVYVADTDNNRVQVFSSKGALVRKWGTQGDGNGQFSHGDDIDIGPDGTVWVSDDGNERVQGFSPAGAFKTSLPLPTGHLARGVAVDAKGNVYASAEGSGTSGYFRYPAGGTGWEGLVTGGKGPYRADDVEVSPDGTIFVGRQATQSADALVQRFSAEGKLLGSFKLSQGGDGQRGIAVDPDCNVWTANTPQRRIDKRSPSGKLLATASVPDLIANDIGFGPKGDFYVTHQNTGIVHFAEDRSKPATANVPGTLRASGSTVTIPYTLSGVACPAEVAATATLKGAVSGKAVGLKLKAGGRNTITMKLAKAGSGPATFTIVLKTNGRPTTETKKVTVK